MFPTAITLPNGQFYEKSSKRKKPEKADIKQLSKVFTHYQQRFVE